MDSRRFNVLFYTRYFLQKKYDTLISELNNSEVDIILETDSNFLRNNKFEFPLDIHKKIFNSVNSERELDIDYNEIINRCRLLRNIEKSIALKLINHYYQYFSFRLRYLKVDIVVTQAVDNYILHILNIVCDQLGVIFWGISGSFFKGYNLLSQQTTKENIAAVNFKYPNDIVADQVNYILNNNSIREYNRSSNYNMIIHSRDVLLNYIRRIIFFILRNFFWEGRISYHWYVTKFNFGRMYLAQYFSPKKIKIINNFSDLDNNKKSLLIPLNCTPEMTIDYWIKEKVINDYESFILTIVDALSKHFNVCIKEHPHALGTRNKFFYKKLVDKNVYLIDPNKTIKQACLSINNLFGLILGTGSAGIESFINGERVFSFSKSIYWNDKNVFYLDPNNVHCWSELILNIKDFQVGNDIIKFNFIENSMRSLIPIDVFSSKNTINNKIKVNEVLSKYFS